MSAAEGVDLGVAEVAAPDANAVVTNADGVSLAGDQLLVTLAEGAGQPEADAVAAALGGQVVGRIEIINLWQLAIPATSAQGVQAAAAAASKLPGVESAFANEMSTLDEEVQGVRQTPFGKPPYDGADGQGYLMLGVDMAWRTLQASGLPRHPVHIGIIDTGVWTGNGEFGRVALDPLYPDPALLKAPPDTFGGHGTEVANVIAADPTNGGVAGIAGILDNLTISVTNAYTPPYGTRSGVFWTGALSAILGQVRSGSRVVNMSWGCTNCSSSEAAFMRECFEKLARDYPGVLFVASAGNDNLKQPIVDGTRTFPGGLARPNMITVGNIRNDGKAAPSSNRASPNFEVTLAAPGAQAVQAMAGDGKVVDDDGGTSMAAAEVTGAAALLLSIEPDLTAAQLKQLLTGTARSSVGGFAAEDGVGSGVLAIDAAVGKLVNDKRGDNLSAE